MTTVTLTIDDKQDGFMEAFQKFTSKFKGVSFEVETIETEEEVLASFTKAMQDINSGEAVKGAKPIEDLYKELANG
ncbi:MAG: Unknown protein [uncultured Campylobacterales bacterium]|uniref:Uncharacterized protein n=1 Tax=uncultured Campylobacterales bacterium TaxID=352960 RepID=A0A6S6TF43_9BACT|nr:MAG: Unknown protein [uncultured Campylobacterales bacterium]